MKTVGSGIKRKLLAACAAILLTAVALLALVSVKSVSLPFVPGLVSGYLDRNFYAYDVAFDELRVRWHPLGNVVEFQISGVYAADFNGETIASIPEVVVGLTLSSLISADPEYRYVAIMRPRVSLVRTAGGAVKFDIGSSTDGSSGRILEHLLIGIATAPTHTEGMDAFPRISIAEARASVGDEVSGSLLRVSNADVVLAPDPKGVRSHYDIEIVTNGGKLHLSAESLYKTSDQRIDLSVDLDRFRPALLAEILPQLFYLAPVEVPLSGKVELQLDKFLTVSRAVFDLTGEIGSLEVVEHIGRNVKLTGLRVRGNMSEALSRVQLDELWIETTGGTVMMRGAFASQNQVLSIKTDALLSGTSLDAIVPQWFAHLESAIDKLNFVASPDNALTFVSFDGRLVFADGGIAGNGVLSYPVGLKPEDDVDAVAGHLAGGGDRFSVEFAVRGSLAAPTFVLSPAESDGREFNQ